MAGVSTSQGHTNYSRGWYKAKVGISSRPSGIRCSRVYRNFFILLVMGFFSKKKPPRPIFVFENTRDLKNIFLKNRLKSFFYQSHWIAFGLTIPKWYNTWVLKIFLDIFFEKIFLKIFEKYFFKKYLQKIYPIPKCYTILESWDQMQFNLI